MSLFNVFNIAGSGMSAQSVRLNLTASNLANAESVATRPEDAYRACHPVFQSVLEEAGGAVIDLNGQPLRYNRKDSLLNPEFIACGDPDQDWARVLGTAPVS